MTPSKFDGTRTPERIPINGFTTGDFWGDVLDAYETSWIPVP